MFFITFRLCRLPFFLFISLFFLCIFVPKKANSQQRVEQMTLVCQSMAVKVPEESSEERQNRLLFLAFRDCLTQVLVQHNKNPESVWEKIERPLEKEEKEQNWRNLISKIEFLIPKYSITKRSSEEAMIQSLSLSVEIDSTSVLKWYQNLIEDSSLLKIEEAFDKKEENLKIPLVLFVDYTSLPKSLDFFKELSKKLKKEFIFTRWEERPSRYPYFVLFQKDFSKNADLFIQKSMEEISLLQEFQEEASENLMKSIEEYLREKFSFLLENYKETLKNKNGPYHLFSLEIIPKETVQRPITLDSILEIQKALNGIGQVREGFFRLQTSLQSLAKERAVILIEVWGEEKELKSLLEQEKSLQEKYEVVWKISTL